MINSASVAACVMGLVATASTASAGSFAEFESGQVRPLAMSPDGKTLFAVNTPDNRLEIFTVRKNDLTKLDSVPVGMEPVAVAARTSSEVWVVNHLSDSISIVDLSSSSPRVVRTLLVGDEPRDIVFAGPNRSRAFITTAHRGQNSPIDPQFNTPGIGRADVWVFDANNLGSSLGGSPLTIVTLFADTPRSLAVTPDGNTVYAAGFLTGNQTSIVGELQYPDFLRVPPFENISDIDQPKVGIIVKFIDGHWIDAIGTVWDWYFMFTLPDKDVFAIDATANPPVQRSTLGYFAHVGTVLYNMAVNPVNGKVYVSNTDARNDHRFEGGGVFASEFGFDTVRGHHNENRITVIDPAAGSVQPRHLNKHINFSHCCDPIPNDENSKSLAIPTGMVVSSNGATLYVAALGSSKIGVYSTAQLESDTFVPSTADQIAVTGGGPTGLVLDESRNQLLVLTRFDDSVKVIDLASRTEVKAVAMYNPEPAVVTNGRRFLYDAQHTSAHGDSACATCHVFGDFDGLSWDLGDPDGQPFANNNAKVTVDQPFGINPNPVFAPMKGPMNTQSLRGLSNAGPMHWRGDRSGASDPGSGLIEPNAQPDSGAFNEHIAFVKFNVAFGGLIGRNEQLPAAEMDAFASFMLQVMYPPNPNRALDNSLTASQQEGRNIYFHPLEFRSIPQPDPNGGFMSGNACNSCHVLDPNGNAEFGVQFPGFFGTDGRTVKVPFPQEFKVPHFRNLYQKVGMFGNVNQPLPIFGPNAPPVPVFDQIPGQEGFLGDQIRGFGFSRAGDIDSALRFISNFVFDSRSPFGPCPLGSDPLVCSNNKTGFPSNADGTTNAEGLRQKMTVIDFLMAYDSNLKPIVGQQITLTSTNSSTVMPRVNLLTARADAGDCDLVAKAPHKGSNPQGYFYVGSGMFMTDRASMLYMTLSSLLATTGAGDAITFTCVPPGNGLRDGIDRDEDGYYDSDDKVVGPGH